MNHDMPRRRGSLSAQGAAAAWLAIGTRRVAAQAAITFRPVFHDQDRGLTQPGG